MSAPIIRVENLSKRYVIGHRRGKEDGLRHRIEEAVRDPWKWFRNGANKTKPEEFWALKDVSFDVQQGEVLGIIGRNGAGKSTLLKILSRITEPTEGRIAIEGRVASLLEVGTGFHPELTGRENIFLNGAILGMSRLEIRRKFDEIIAFAEIEKFLDTPVKRYSSGMYVRLAFAVAAHLEPEILIVDEVLAVGDVEFQKKCLGKMQDVSRSGRTVLFVSHNLNAVTALCNTAAVLREGKLAFKGAIGQALAYYGASTDVSDSFELAGKNGSSILKGVQISNKNASSPPGIFEPLADVTLQVALATTRILNKPRLGIAFANSRGERVFAIGSYLGPTALPPLIGSHSIHVAFTMPPVIPGKYTFDIGFYDSEAKVNEEYYSVGAIEVAQINYLQMIDPDAVETGQLHVRSTCWVTASQRA